MKRYFGGVTLAGLLLATVACQPTAQPGANAPANTNGAPGVNTNAGPQQGAAANLTPGTPEYIVANQPDFGGTMNLSVGPQQFQAKVWRKGGASRLEADASKVLPTLPANSQVIALARPGQPTYIIVPDQKTYVEGAFTPVTNPADYIGTYLNRFQQMGLRVEQVGTEMINGRETVKLRFYDPTTAANTNAPGAQGTEIFAYAAKDLNNLIVRMNGTISGQPFQIDVQDPSLEVQDAVFTPPPGFPEGYRKLDATALANPPGVGAGQPPQGAQPGAPQQKQP